MPISDLLSRRRSLDGRVVAITGGARGLGLATARALAARSCRLALGDLDGELASREAAALPGGGPHAGFPVDVTDDSAFAAFLDVVEERLGAVDVLINNAGIMLVGPFVDEDPVLTRREIDINLGGVITGTKLALGRMLPRGDGHVINIASAAGKTGLGGEATYCATKHAVVGFDESLHMELRGTGVHITTVMPSLAATSLSAGMEAPRGLPMVDPEDIASAIVRAIERPRLEVYIPRRLNGLFRSRALMPQRMKDVAARMFRSDRIGIEVDVAERSRGYMERTAKSAASTASAENEAIAEAAKRE